MKKFAEIVEDVKLLSVPEKEELLDLLDRILVEDRRREFIENHKESLTELRTGKLKFYDNVNDAIQTLNEE